VQTWTLRALILGALSACALIGAGVGMPAGTAPARPSAPDGFGGPLEAHAVVRPIARDLTVGAGASLRQVPCAAGTGRACFSAR
jgi:hypothetical protein